MAKKKRHTIVRVLVETFRRLRVAEVELDGSAGLVTVTGKNKAGKSSLLKAIAGALGGQGEVEEGSVQDGAGGRSLLKVILSNGYTVQRKFTSKAPKGYLTITGPNGETSTQQSLLNDWLGPHSFDPLALMTLDLKRQWEILLGCGKNPNLALHLDENRLKQKRVYEERTPHISAQRRAAGEPKPEGLRPEPMDTSAQVKKLQDLQAQADERFQLIGMLGRQEDFLDSRLEALKNAEVNLAYARSQVEQAETTLQLRQEEVTTQTEKRDALQLQVEQTADPAEAIQEVQVELARADAVQEHLQVWRDWDRAQEDHKKATAEVDRLTTQLDELKEQESQLIAEAGIPVPGLSFSEEGEPLLNGKSFSLASGAEKIEVAVAVALAVNPEVGVCLVDEANDLDLEHLEALDKLARKHGFQIWACRLGLEGAGEVVVEDGVATNRKEGAS